MSELEANNTENLPVILMGDFNEGPSGEVRNQINSSSLNLKDSWTKKEEGSHHRFTGKNEDTVRIDWVMHSSSLSSKETSLVKDSKENLYPSDHFPVITTISF